MIETKSKEINGSNYSVTQMTARKALRVKARLLKTFGTALSEIFIPDSDDKIKGASYSKKSAVNAINRLCENLDDVTFENLVNDLLINVRKDGVELTPAIVDLEFAGDLETLYDVLWFVLEVNYSSFLAMFSTSNQTQEVEEKPKQKLRTGSKKA